MSSGAIATAVCRAYTGRHGRFCGYLKIPQIELRNEVVSSHNELMIIKKRFLKKDSASSIRREVRPDGMKL